MPHSHRRLESLVRPLLGDLHRFACRLTGDAVRADDLLQQALLVAVRKLDQLEHDAAFRVWMSRIVYRTHLNQQDRKMDPIRHNDGLDEGHHPGREPGPEQAAANRRLGLRLVDALDQLPHDQREAVWLVDGQGLTFAEAAEVLGVRAGTCASRVARGRAALRVDLRHDAKERGVIR